MTGPYRWEGNVSWPVKVRTARSGRPWAAFGMLTDDGARLEVVAFGTVAESCAGIGRGARVRIASRKPPERRQWTAAGVDRDGVRLVACRVEVLGPLPAEEARRRIVGRILAAAPDGVLHA